MQSASGGVYFARVQHKGKLFRVSPGTERADGVTTANLRLPDQVKEKLNPFNDLAMALSLGVNIFPA
jgi:hypothetical protein